MTIKFPDPLPYPKTRLITELRKSLYRLTRLAMSDLPPSVAEHVAAAKAEIEAAAKEMQVQSD